MLKTHANQRNKSSSLRLYYFLFIFTIQQKRIILDDQFQLAMKSKDQWISKKKILEKPYNQLSDFQTKPKLKSHNINVLEHKKTKKGIRSIPEEWLISFQIMRNQIISECLSIELDYVWKTGKIQEVNDEIFQFQKDSNFWEQQQDQLILHFYFTPDRYLAQMKELLSSKSSKSIIQRYVFHNIQDIQQQFPRIEAIENLLKKWQQEGKTFD